MVVSKDKTLQRTAGPSALSLFSGIGGFEVGMAPLGFNFVKNLEWDADCCKTLNRNGMAEDRLEPITVTDIWLTEPEGFYRGQVDFIVGGPPCQSFSAAGRRAGGVMGTSDVRGTLFWRYCEYVSHFKPKAFVFENVRGILSSKGGKDFDLIRQAFMEIGYNLYWRVLNSADFGVPQFRERLYLVGLRHDLNIDFKFPRPTHGPDSLGAIPYISASQAMGHLDDGIEAGPYGGKYGHLLPQIPPGENYRVFTEEMGHESPQFAWRSKFSGFLYKMDPNLPCRTIVSQQSRYDGPFHWRNRKCTSDELKLLQGFPQEFVLPESYGAAVKQIGNSVTPPVARQIGIALLQQIEGDRSYGIELISGSHVLSFDRAKSVRAAASRSKRVVQYDLRLPSLFDNNGDIEASEPEIVTSWEEVGATNARYVKLVIPSSDRGVSKKASLTIQFSGSLASRLSNLQIEMHDSRTHENLIQAIWMLANKIVANISSFESLTPLWGHFTEPYPKFEFQYETTRRDIIARYMKISWQLCAVQSQMTEIEFASKLSSLDVKSAVESLRRAGFDIRTHETHPAIPQGMVRCCYPFPTLALGKP